MKKRRNWAPFLLILPSVIYLAIFFAWPMFRAMTLAVWDESAALRLHEEADADSRATGTLSTGRQVQVLDRQGNVLEGEAVGASNLQTERWFAIQGVDSNGQPVAGWAQETRVRVREQDASGKPLAGTVRRKLGSDVDPLTDVFFEASVLSPVVGRLDANASVAIVGQTMLELWYLIRGEASGETAEGWAQSRYIQVYSNGETGRVDRGNAGELTMRYIQAMVNDRFFWPAFWTTLLLMVLIIPVQFVLAIIMALIIQQQLKGNSIFLYIFAIALGVSDLAVGIVWYAIFTQYGLSLIHISEPTRPY